MEIINVGKEQGTDNTNLSHINNTTLNETLIVQSNNKCDDIKKQQEKQIMDTIEQASGKILVEHKELEFSIHEETKQIMIKVLDQRTKEVILEVPPEKVLDIVAKMQEYTGLFIDEKK